MLFCSKMVPRCVLITALLAASLVQSISSDGRLVLDGFLMERDDWGTDLQRRGEWKGRRRLHQSDAFQVGMQLKYGREYAPCSMHLNYGREIPAMPHVPCHALRSRLGHPSSFSIQQKAIDQKRKRAEERAAEYKQRPAEEEKVRMLQAY